MRLGRAGAAAAVLACAILGCSGKVRSYETWESQGETLVPTHPVSVELIPPVGAFPWAGTVSHHLLAAPLIDRWFAELAKRRSVEVFYVLSPSHWGLSTEAFSLTDGSWRVKGGSVESDRPGVAELARSLGVTPEPSVFDPEHGVSTLAPFIARYFPRARIVAVAYQGEPPVDQPKAKKLLRALGPAFTVEGKKRNFLLVSTDFSHHGDEASTAETDKRTRRFFDNPSWDTWLFAGCDNRPGIYALAGLLDSGTRCGVLYHSDSLALSGQGSTDITSYYFTFFWETGR